MKDRNQRRQQYAYVPELDKAHMDEIAVMSDDDLQAKIKSLLVDRDRAHDPKPCEVELAYHMREMLLRWGRRSAHDAYLARMDREAESLKRLENSYPAADLDNSAFMFWN